MGNHQFTPPFYTCSTCEAGPCYRWWGFVGITPSTCNGGNRNEPDWRPVRTYTISLDREFFVVGKEAEK